jgi:hypothetical protein
MNTSNTLVIKMREKNLPIFVSLDSSKQHAIVKYYKIFRHKPSLTQCTLNCSKEMFADIPIKKYNA